MVVREFEVEEWFGENGGGDAHDMAVAVEVAVVSFARHLLVGVSLQQRWTRKNNLFIYLVIRRDEIYFLFFLK